MAFSGTATEPAADSGRSQKLRHNAIAEEVVVITPPNLTQQRRLTQDYPPEVNEETNVQLSASLDFSKLRDPDEAEAYFRKLPSNHQWSLVHRLVSSAVITASVTDARLVGEILAQGATRGFVSPDVFEAGFAPTMDILDILVSRTPNAASLVAIMLKGLRLDKDRLGGLLYKAKGDELQILHGLLL
ncbi:uncharacterized protein C8Q71DRAFT_771064 [Rhodofomes roseus]|uniref:Uncharacterized protein n=1 Tax=Rhodofomes roseus TaxID=34475 RepID=A0ABQ8KA05_9APHY|nr:uncharacterized protein C8Q71DRAFT_771064 [Rhodofomes roseus]KAH9834097.1 hypothetical protein C8Q71DRAFT_771064 [Rhodofomes roseus]